MTETTTTAAGWVPERQRYSIRKAIEKLKAEIRLETYAGELTELKRQGANLVGLCPIHDEKTPSFAVYDDGHFHCFGCKHHGDVIDLCELAERHAETWTAVVSLSMRFGVELPRRPQRWHENQERKMRIRDAAAEVRGNVLKRRLFKLLILPTIDVMCDDPEEHEAELERAWAEWNSRPIWRGLGTRFGS